MPATPGHALELPGRRGQVARRLAREADDHRRRPARPGRRIPLEDGLDPRVLEAHAAAGPRPGTSAVRGRRVPGPRPERRAAGHEAAEPRQVDDVGHLDAVPERPRRGDHRVDEHEAATRGRPRARRGGRRGRRRATVRRRSRTRRPARRRLRATASGGSGRDRRLDPAHRRRARRPSRSARGAWPSRRLPPVELVGGERRALAARPHAAPPVPGDHAAQARARGAPDPRARRAPAARPCAAPPATRRPAAARRRASGPASRRRARPRRPAASPARAPSSAGGPGGERLVGPALVVEHQVEDRARDGPAMPSAVATTYSTSSGSRLVG